MLINATIQKYLAALIEGDRNHSRQVIEKVLKTGMTTTSVYSEIIWPIMTGIEKLLCDDKITPVQEHLATRINRTIVDELQNKLPRKPLRGKKIVVCCADDELQELGAQIMADLFESNGWQVRFLGGGLTNDDILAFVNQYNPDILLIYGTTPRQAPCIRKLIDIIRDVNAYPEMQIMVSGGLFNRADGLWEEMGADLFARTALEAIQTASANEPPSPRRPQKNRRNKRTRSKTPAAGAI